MTQIQKLQASLPKLTDYRFDDAGDLVTTEVAPRSFIRDGLLYVSTEGVYGVGDFCGKYIAEDTQDGIAYIFPSFEAWATKNGGYFEWQDPSTIVFIA